MFLDPPGSLGVWRIFHSYPLKRSVLIAGGAKIRASAVATARMGPPFCGRTRMVGGGRYPEDTSSAAYAMPGCVEFFHVQSGWIAVRGSDSNGCTHQTPLLASNTIC